MTIQPCPHFTGGGEQCTVCRERDRLAEALRWYADPENYRDTLAHSTMGRGTAWHVTPALDDAGQRAREALEEPKP